MRSTLLLVVGAVAVGFVLGTRSTRPVVRESTPRRALRRVTRRR
ncbi:hypothetical protein [Agrococcus jejuensis]|uniref:Uncharacterized protein n=1 Tax=Agrococcus jejuensis TaxID=399736 RepID=A0A1G8DQ18_9MICO|nr:hypothetical protein [Agrococcus jejuensis]SDH59735.1 hypothetical protein SAMN04489720_1732 [Agrococcus jejuensis]